MNYITIPAVGSTNSWIRSVQHDPTIASILARALTNILKESTEPNIRQIAQTALNASLYPYK